MIRIYIGKSAAGKDHMYRRDLEAGFLPVISYTTRPIREKEVDGRDYNFISKERFLEMTKVKDCLLEWRSYDTLVNGIPDTWYYGSPVVDPEKDHVAVLTPDGVKAYIDRYGKDNLQVFYVTASEKTRTRRAKRRGSFDESEWNRRLETDNKDFSEEVINNLRKALGSSFHIMIND